VKIRVHNEWFMPLAKKTCPCGEKKTQVFAWGEYVSGKWRTVDHFCRACFSTEVIPRLLAHAGDCGRERSSKGVSGTPCTFAMNPRSGYSLPEWIKMPDNQSCKAA
jgi:hypothetical protein